MNARRFLCLAIGFFMIKTVEKKSPAQSNQSTDKLLTLVEAMSVLAEPVRLQDLAHSLGMNPATVLRFLAPLQQRGYVAQEPDTNRYYLTFKLCAVANNISTRQDMRNIVVPFLRQLSHVFRETSGLSVENDMAVVYVDMVNAPDKSLALLQRIGHVAPLHCTGVGKVFLTEFSQQRIDQLIASKGLPRFTDNTIVTRDELLAAVDEVRRRGYAFDNEECEDGMRCIAAPLRDYTGGIVACVSVSGPVTRMTDTHIHENLPFLLDTAAIISSRLGWDIAV